MVAAVLVQLERHDGHPGQERGALLRHPAPQHQPTDPCTTLSTAGRHSGPMRAAAEPRLGLWSRNQPLPDRGLALSFARSAHGFGLLTGFALGGFLVGFARLHLAEDVLALHLLLQHPEGLINVVVANED